MYQPEKMLIDNSEIVRVVIRYCDGYEREYIPSHVSATRINDTDRINNTYCINIETYYTKLDLSIPSCQGVDKVTLYLPHGLPAPIVVENVLSMVCWVYEEKSKMYIYILGEIKETQDER